MNYIPLETDILIRSSEKEMMKKQLALAITALDEKDRSHGLIISTENPTLVQEQTNVVFNGLGKKLAEACSKCLETQATETEEENEYKITAKVLLQLLESISRIGDGSVSFHHLRDKENFSEYKVSYFESDPYFINNTETVMTVQIRPVDNLINVRNKPTLKAQQRTLIIIKSKDLPYGEAGVRIDPPDKRHQNNIVYDISVGRANQRHATIIDNLKLDQEAGHHFPSGITVGDLRGIKVEDIHRAVATRLEELIK